MALLQSDTARIGHPPDNPTEDRVPEELASGTPQGLRQALSALIGADQVLHRAIDLVRYASDASPYRLIPQVVVTPRTIDDIVALLNYCGENGHHATFRAAGTSLCGQSQSDDILIDVRRHWYGMSIEDRGLALRARPGVILGHARTFLRRHGRRLGPDPASIDACTIGGVIANNAGGMRCTIERDSYHTVRSMTLVLASGTVIDTAQLDAEAAFMRAEPNLAQGLLKLRAELIADRALADRVHHKFAIRNTTGYRLDAFLDADTPLEIFRRLVVGSEGTLAFMGEAVINTLPAPGATCVTWIPLPSIDEAVALVPRLVALGAEAVELMVAPALEAAAQAFPGTPEYWRTLDPKAAALLVEFAATDNAALDQAEAAARALVASANLLHPLDFTRDAEAIEIDWRIREGLLGIVGKLRPEGTAVLNEDVCFPPARIAEGAHDLQALLIKHGFLPGVAGHAAFGNLHFTLTPKLDDPADLKRYGAFMDDLVELVIDKYDGSLKAEHGTGRNMAPFVRREWGDKATEMMWQIKKLADPHGVLAPDSVLSRDDGIHLRRLKSTPTIENISDATHCIECGFCEPACPSRNVTMTPRQRIVIRREIARQPSGSQMFAQLLQEFEYDGIQTCAADGTRAVACPVSINTGALMKSFRQRENTDAREKVIYPTGNHAERRFDQIIGHSAALKSVLDQVELVAPTDSTVLIEGETGTGKELIAHAIHNVSQRLGRPLIKLNCAAIPLDLLESELFGHEKGAFTGAIAQKIGRFEMADKGTLFLDEVGDIPTALQPKLLRVLQEQEFERLGSGQTHKVDVRLVAATNQNLANMKARGQFRSDLYYRLNVFPISVPALRERREDIPALVSHFVKIFSHRMKKQVDSIPPETMAAFQWYSWPGNIRELQNLVERAVILSRDGVLRNPLHKKKPDLVISSPPRTPTFQSSMTLDDTNRTVILRTLEQLGWVVGGPHGAATKLGLKRTTLLARMRRLGISRPITQEGTEMVGMATESIC